MKNNTTWTVSGIRKGLGWGLILLVFHAGGLAADDSGIHFEKKIFFRAPKWDPNLFMGVQFTTYSSNEKNELIQCWTTATPDRYDGIYLRHSTNNGKSWSVSEQFQQVSKLDDGADLRYGNHLVYHDPDHDILLQVYWRKEYRELDTGTPYDSVLEANRSSKLYLQISRDGGRTWGEPVQIIQENGDYDENHWARDIEVGKLSGMVAGCPHIEKLRDGTLLMPFSVQADPDDPGVWKQGVFRGRWKEDLSGIHWTLGDYVALPPRSLSSRGAYVGTLEQLKDGRVFVVMRGHVGMPDGSEPAFPGEVKWTAISEDGGLTWSQPEPLKYDDGGIFWTSSSNSRFFRSKKNGRLYLMAHYLEEPLVGAPRRPLCIMEIDEKLAAVKRDTVTLLQDIEEFDVKGTRWEIRGIYEDRETGELVMYVQGRSKPGTIEVYEHRVSVP